MIEFKDITALRFTSSKFLMKADTDSNRTWTITGKDGEIIKLYKDELFSVMKSDYIPDEVRNITFKGSVQVSGSGSKNVDLSMINDGDVVYCHHSLCDPDNRVKCGDDYYYLIDGVVSMLTYDMSNFYMKLFNCASKIDCERYQMIDRWVMLEPIEEEIKTTLILPKGNKKISDKKHRVTCTNRYSDFNVGDVIVCDKRFLKKISVDDEIKYVTLNRYILAKF